MFRRLMSYRSLKLATVISRRSHFHVADGDDFVRNVMRNPAPVIVNFHADWCHPCRTLTPRLVDIVGGDNDVVLAIVDIEKHPELVHTFEVKAVPAVLAIRCGIVVDKFVGVMDQEAIEKMVKKLKETNE